MTGAEFYTYFNEKIDKAYSDYIDETKATRLFKEVLYRLVTKIYSNADTQKELDELGTMLVKNESVSVTGSVLPVDNLTFEYMHLMRMAFVYAEAQSFTYSNGDYLSSTHTLRKGDVLTLSGASNTATNGDYTVTYVSDSKFRIPLVYVDGTLSLTRTVEATPISSDRKKSSFHTPDKFNPGYELQYDDNFIDARSFVLSPVPSSVLIDYVCKPQIEIDATNTSAELLDYFPEKFIYRLLDEAFLAFAERTADANGAQMASRAIIDNP